MTKGDLNTPPPKQPVDESRRNFLTKTGKYAVIAPVALTTLMDSASANSCCSSSSAVAQQNKKFGLI